MPQEKYDDPQQGGPENQETRNAPGPGQGSQQSKHGTLSEGQMGDGTSGRHCGKTSGRRGGDQAVDFEDDVNVN